MNKDNWTIKLIYSREWEEYQIQCYCNGEYDENKTYFTDDKEDAFISMEILAKSLGITDYSTKVIRK